MKDNEMNDGSVMALQKTAVEIGLLSPEQIAEINRILSGTENTTFENVCLEQNILTTEEISLIKSQSTKRTGIFPPNAPSTEADPGIPAEDLDDDPNQVIGYKIGLLAMDCGMLSRIDYIESYYAHKFAYPDMPFEAYLIDKKHLDVEQVNKLLDISHTINWENYFEEAEEERNAEDLSDGLTRSLDQIFKQIDEQSRKLPQGKATVALPPPDAAEPLAKVEWGHLPENRSSSDSSSADPMDRYDILEEIARGGMGVVFKARQIDLNRIVALKFMLAETSSNIEDRNRFFREAEALANLKHPNIVQVHDVGVSEEGYFFVMDFVEGMSLSEYVMVMGDEFTFRDRLKVMVKVLDAIHFGHQLGLMHRDLKPGNIMINNQGEPIVVDFGLVDDNNTALSAVIDTNEVMGTPHYMAPEHALGNVGPTSDVFALGVVLYELLSENLPFTGSDYAKVLEAVIHKDPVPLKEYKKDIDPEIEAIVFKALEKNPEDRYGSVWGMKEDLVRYLEDEPVEAKRMSRVYYWNKHLRKNRTASVLLLAVFFLVAVGAIWGVMLYLHGKAQLRNTAAEEIQLIQDITQKNTAFLEQAEKHIAAGDFLKAAELRSMIQSGAEQIENVVSNTEVGTVDSEQAAAKWEQEAEHLGARIISAEQKALVEERIQNSDLKYAEGLVFAREADAFETSDVNRHREKSIILINASKLFREALNINPQNEQARTELLRVSFALLDRNISQKDAGISTEETLLALDAVVQSEEEKTKLQAYREKVRLLKIQNKVKSIIRKGNELFFNEEYDEALTAFKQALDLESSEDDKIHLKWKISKVVDVYSNILLDKAENAFNSKSPAVLLEVSVSLSKLGEQIAADNLTAAALFIQNTPEMFKPLFGDFQNVTENGIKGALYVSVNEVTNADYLKFTKAGGYLKPSYWIEQGLTQLDTFIDQDGNPGPAGWSENQFPAGEETKPVTGTNYYEASAYASWLSKTSGKQYNIPDENCWKNIYSQTDGIEEYPWAEDKLKRLTDTGFRLIILPDSLAKK